jgi:hypothetical protein
VSFSSSLRISVLLMRETYLLDENFQGRNVRLTSGG